MPYYEQPGRTTTIDKDGKQIITITFVGTEPAPKPADLTGTVKSKSVTKDVAGQIRTQYQVESDAASFADPVQSQNVVVEIVAAVRTVPIEAHPNFSEPHLYPEDKKKIRDAVQVPDRSPTFDDTTDQKRAVSLYGYLINGVESYYVPSLIVRKTYQASSPPSDKHVGKIGSPGVSVPSAPKGATFLLVNLTSRGSANSYSVTEEWEMSGEGGWDTFLYKDS